MPWPALAAYGHDPTPGEIALLRAALGRGPLDAAGSALATEAARTGADRAALRLLPLLHRSPAAADLAPELRAAAERAYREAQARFVRLERELAAVAAALGGAGIPVMVLKGYALARAHYANPALRPMADLDLAVPAGRHADALAVLARGGTRVAADDRPWAVGAGIHAAVLLTEAGTEIDLHGNILSCSRWDGADDGFWARALPLPVRGHPAVRLSAADQLFHACLHGYRGNAGPSPVRWIADAVAILEGREPFGAAEWATLLAEAGRHRCEGVLCASLACLAGRLGAPVPAEVLDRLATAPARPLDDAYFRFTGQPPRRLTLAWRLEAAWRDYRRNHGRLPLLRAALGFPAWTAARWGIATGPPALARELARRLRIVEP